MKKNSLTKLFMKDDSIWYASVVAICVLASGVFYNLLHMIVESFVTDQQTNAGVDKFTGNMVEENTLVSLDPAVLKVFFTFIGIFVLVLLILSFTQLLYIFNRERDPIRTLFIAHLPFTKKQVIIRLWLCNYIPYALGYLLCSILVYISTLGIHRSFAQYDAISNDSLSAIRNSLLLGFVMITFFYSFFMAGYCIFSSAAFGGICTFMTAVFLFVSLEGYQYFFSAHFKKIPLPTPSNMVSALKPFSIYLDGLIADYYELKAYMPGSAEEAIEMIGSFDVVGQFSYVRDAQEVLIDGELRALTFAEARDIPALLQGHDSNFMWVTLVLAVLSVALFGAALYLYNRNEFSRNNSSLLSMFQVHPVVSYIAVGLISFSFFSYMRYGSDLNDTLIFGGILTFLSLLVWASIRRTFNKYVLSKRIQQGKR